MQRLKYHIKTTFNISFSKFALLKTKTTLIEKL